MLNWLHAEILQLFWSTIAAELFFFLRVTFDVYFIQMFSVFFSSFIRNWQKVISEDSMAHNQVKGRKKYTCRDNNTDIHTNRKEFNGGWYAIRCAMPCAGMCDPMEWEMALYLQSRLAMLSYTYRFESIVHSDLHAFLWGWIYRIYLFICFALDRTQIDLFSCNLLCLPKKQTHTHIVCDLLRW